MEDWKRVKEFISITGSEPVIIDFLRETNLPYTSSSKEAVKEIDACITNVQTDEGVKSCITFHIEDLANRFRGGGFKKEATEIYSKLVIASKAVEDTWGKFTL